MNDHTPEDVLDCLMGLVDIILEQGEIKEPYHMISSESIKELRSILKDQPAQKNSTSA